MCRQRDELEDQLRHISMEREKIKKSMVWCLDHSDSAEEVCMMYVCTNVLLWVIFLQSEEVIVFIVERAILCQ